MKDIWRNRGKWVLLAAVAVSSALSCSVKEDRTECPVYVTVLTDRFVSGGLDGGILSFSGAQHLVKRDSVSFLSFLREGYEQACPRDQASVAVLSGLENNILTERTMEVLPGMQADLVWAYGVGFSAHADSYVIDAVPHKQYCLVKFLFDGEPEAPPGYPWRFRLTAACSGMDIYTLEPLPGHYCCAVGPNAAGHWYGVLPRQKDHRIGLELFIPEGEDGTEGRTDYEIDLGKAFAQQGYDWTAEDLRDIEVVVGFTEAGIAITVREWEGDSQYRNIEI